MHDQELSIYKLIFGTAWRDRSSTVSVNLTSVWFRIHNSKLSSKESISNITSADNYIQTRKCIGPETSLLAFAEIIVIKMLLHAYLYQELHVLFFSRILQLKISNFSDTKFYPEFCFVFFNIWLVILHDYHCLAGRCEFALPLRSRNFFSAVILPQNHLDSLQFLF